MIDFRGKNVLHMALDTETTLMAINNVIPKLICMSVTDSQRVRTDDSAGLLVPWGPTPNYIQDQLIHVMENFVASKENVNKVEEVHIVGANIAFDLSVLCMAYPDLLPYCFKWLDEDRIHDVLLREKNYNLTVHGEIDFIKVNGMNKKCGYKLSDLDMTHLNIDRSEDKEGEDSVRLTYYLMDQKPLKEWPEQYVRYAKDDAVCTLLDFEAQETLAQQYLKDHNVYPFTTQSHKVRTAFALRLLECTGTLTDPERLLQVEQEISTEYMSPRLRDPLILNRFLDDAVPERPHAKGVLDHVFGCLGHKEHPQFKKGKCIQGCGCSIKMIKAKPEKYKTDPLQNYVLALAKADPRVQLTPSDACKKLLKENGLWKGCVDEDGFFYQTVIDKISTRQIRENGKEKIVFKLNDTWQASYALLDPLLSIWSERNKFKKMRTDYLPKLFYKVQGVKTPAPIIHAGYDALKKTGRTSSFASKLYPSRNDQNVDPRIRACTVPRPGKILLSTDYSGMELGTTAQICYGLFGYSVLRDLINEGIDTHAYLGAQIAYTFDPTFFSFVQSRNLAPDVRYIFDAFWLCKNSKVLCDSSAFLQIYAILHPENTVSVTWGDFFDHYRKFAKPTGLGYPGGLGAKTFIAYAKGTYGVDVDLMQAKSLKEIWAATFPEIPEYHKWLSKGMIDYNHQGDIMYDDEGKPHDIKYYMYATPGGLYRSRCTFCQAANGNALQAPSAEGATDGLYKGVKAIWLSEPGTLFDGCMTDAFIHDEILWESPEDQYVGQRAREMERILCEAMMIITPDVTARAETAAMRRWDKKAKPLWDGDVLSVWEPKEK